MLIQLTDVCVFGEQKMASLVALSAKICQSLNQPSLRVGLAWYRSSLEFWFTIICAQFQAYLPFPVANVTCAPLLC